MAKIEMLYLHCGHDIPCKDAKFSINHEQVWCPFCKEYVEPSYFALVEG